MLLCLVVALAGLALAMAVARQHQLNAAADLASVAAASQLQHGENACAVARRTVLENHAKIQSCEVRGEDVVVSVSDVLHLPFDLRARLVAEARAGPAYE